MTLEERAKEFVSKMASGTSQEMDYYANILVEFANEATKELQKENAGLKEKLEMGIALKDEEIGCIQTDFNTFKSKAKELLKQWLSLCGFKVEKLSKDTEQFLSEVEKWQ